MAASTLNSLVAATVYKHEVASRLHLNSNRSYRLFIPKRTLIGLGIF